MDISDDNDICVVYKAPAQLKQQINAEYIVKVFKYEESSNAYRGGFSLKTGTFQLSSCRFNSGNVELYGLTSDLSEMQKHVVSNFADQTTRSIASFSASLSSSLFGTAMNLQFHKVFAVLVGTTEFEFVLLDPTNMSKLAQCEFLGSDFMFKMSKDGSRKVCLTKSLTEWEYAEGDASDTKIFKKTEVIEDNQMEFLGNELYLFYTDATNTLYLSIQEWHDQKFYKKAVTISTSNGLKIPALGTIEEKNYIYA